MSVVITVVLFDLVATMGQPAASGDDERVLGRVAAAQSATQRTPAG
jgi:hypothetical protein